MHRIQPRRPSLPLLALLVIMAAIITTTGALHAAHLLTLLAGFVLGAA